MQMWIFRPKSKLPFQFFIMVTVKVVLQPGSFWAGPLVEYGNQTHTEVTLCNLMPNVLNIRPLRIFFVIFSKA